MYVAVTRAKEKVFVSYCSRRYMYGQSKYQTQSRFIKELKMVKNRFEVEEQKQTYSGFSVKNFFKREAIKSEKKDVYVYKIGQKVEHPKFGEGVILDITPDHLVADIEFEGFGKKSLMLELAPLEIIEDI